MGKPFTLGVCWPLWVDLLTCSIFRNPFKIMLVLSYRYIYIYIYKEPLQSTNLLAVLKLIDESIFKGLHRVKSIVMCRWSDIYTSLLWEKDGIYHMQDLVMIDCVWLLIVRHQLQDLVVTDHCIWLLILRYQFHLNLHRSSSEAVMMTHSVNAMYTMIIAYPSISDILSLQKTRHSVTFRKDDWQGKHMWTDKYKTNRVVSDKNEKN